MESVLCLKMETSLPPTPQDLNYLPKGKVHNTSVTLQALWDTKMAVNQGSTDVLSTPSPSANSIPWGLEQILCLKRQQLQQIQLTEQIRSQVSTVCRPRPPLCVAGADTLKTLSRQRPSRFLRPWLCSARKLEAQVCLWTP